MTNKQSINFRDLNKYIGNGVIFMGITDSDDFTPEAVTDLFENFEWHNKVVEIRKVEENVLGDEGRTDWLCIFDGAINGIRPMPLMQDVKWIEDFIDNYKGDYKW